MGHPRIALTPPPAESRALTGLRGVAACMVVVHHLVLHAGLDAPSVLLRSLTQRGYLGVDLFFVLSGFVMAMVYGGWFQPRLDGGGTDGSAWPMLALRFWSRRLARLWPLHAAVLAAMVALLPPQHPLSARLLLANFGLIQAWGLSAAINPPAWSVSTEFAAYLLFPFVAAPCLHRRGGGWLCLAFIVAALAACIALAPPLGPARRGELDLFGNYSILPLLRCLAGFTAGMLAWRLGRLGVVQALARSSWSAPALLAAVLLGLLLHLDDLVILALLPALVLALHLGTGHVHRLLAAAPLHGLGVLSYAIYLLHYGLLLCFPFGRGPAALMVPAYAVATVLLAAILYRVVERPGRAMLRHAADGMLSARAAPRRVP